MYLYDPYSFSLDYQFLIKLSSFFSSYGLNVMVLGFSLRDLNPTWSKFFHSIIFLMRIIKSDEH